MGGGVREEIPEGVQEHLLALGLRVRRRSSLVHAESLAGIFFATIRLFDQPKIHLSFICIRIQNILNVFF